MPSRHLSTSINPTASPQPISSPRTTHSHFPLAPPIAAGAGLCSALLLCFLFCKKFRWKRASAAESNSPRRYSYAALKKATLKFSESKRVGQGGFGSVYAGVLPGRRKKEEVAVKLMDSGSLQGEREFQNELLVAEKLVGCEYVLRLLGFASSRKHMVLVYEFMCNGSLQDALLLKKDVRLKDWNCRYLIALDVARGIEYLHSRDPVIVHCDVKPSNVLLDGNMRAKIGDFGLARVKEVEGKRIEDVVVVGGGIEEMDETESVTTMTTVGMDDFSVCMDQSPESVFKVLSDEQSPIRSESQVVIFPKISEGRESVECSSIGHNEIACAEGEKGLEEIDVRIEGDDVGQHDNSGAVNEYVMEWIGTEIKKERPRNHLVGDSSSNEVKAKAERKKKKKHLDWWVSLEEEKTKRRPAREWWKEEYCRDLVKKQKKNKRRQVVESPDDGHVNSWWPRNEGSTKGIKFSRSGSKRSRGSLDWWLDGLNGESWRGLHNSYGSGSGEFPKSGAMSSTPSMRGTVCYVAPEYGGVADNMNFSEKCDVYSYGVLLLVIIAGRRPLQVTGSPMSEFKRANLVSWARHLSRAGKLIELVDKSVQSVNQDQALCCIKVALLCLQKSPSLRPSMKEVVGMLSGTLSLPELPPELSPSPPSRHKKNELKMAIVL